MKFAITGLLAVLASTAQSAVVQQQYTAYVTGVSSASEIVAIGSQPVQELDRLTGTFSFDNAMVGETAPPFTPLPYEYGYRGTVQSNFITAALNGVSVAAAPTAGTSSCSFIDPLCANLPIVMKRSAGPTILDQATDVLSLNYSIPASGPFVVTNGPARVSRVTMDFFFPGELPGSALPGQVNLEDLRFAQLMLAPSCTPASTASRPPPCLSPKPGHSCWQAWDCWRQSPAANAAPRYRSRPSRRAAP